MKKRSALVIYLLIAGLSLPKGACRTVILKTGKEISDEELKRELKIRSLFDLKSFSFRKFSKDEAKSGQV